MFPYSLWVIFLYFQNNFFVFSFQLKFLDQRESLKGCYKQHKTSNRYQNSFNFSITIIILLCVRFLIPLRKCYPNALHLIFSPTFSWQEKTFNYLSFHLSSSVAHCPSMLRCGDVRTVLITLLSFSLPLSLPLALLFLVESV